MFAASAFAADIVSPPDQLAAVSEINGKLEFGGGFGGMDGFGSTNPVYGGGSITMPLGNAFGLQGDFAVDNQFGQTEIGGAAHLFTRDPNRYLLGAMGGYASFGQASGAWIGPEAELYMDRISLEAIGGYIRVTPMALMALISYMPLAISAITQRTICASPLVLAQWLISNRRIWVQNTCCQMLACPFRSNLTAESVTTIFIPQRQALRSTSVGQART